MSLRNWIRFLYQPPTFRPGTYGQVIHEMAEMAAVDFGQHDQGNQPVHSFLYFFTAAGSPWKTQYWTRRVLEVLYTPDSFPGDEDNGEMASWYVLNALGLGPLCPGVPEYVLVSPLFPAVHVHLAGGKTLAIEAPNTSRDECLYPEHVSLNGQGAPPALHRTSGADRQGGICTSFLGHQPPERQSGTGRSSLFPLRLTCRHLRQRPDRASHPHQLRRRGGVAISSATLLSRAAAQATSRGSR